MLAHPLLDLGLSVSFVLHFDVFSPFGSTTLFEVVGLQRWCYMFLFLG